MRNLFKFLNRWRSARTTQPLHSREKYQAELAFWRHVLEQYQAWYLGQLDTLYGEPAPSEEQRIKAGNLRDSAVLTWTRVHQYRKYLEDLSLPNTAFVGKDVLDVGSGPLPSALVFEGCQLYCLDALLDDYVQMGFPVKNDERVRFVRGVSEDIPLGGHSVDVVISVNAIDHVDDLTKTSREIRRVLRRGGLLRMHVHYHPKTPTEPMELDDEVMAAAFRWCPGFGKIAQSKIKRGWTLTDERECYALWSS